MATDENKGKLTDAAKASVLDSGALANLKAVSHDASSATHDEIDSLKQQAHSAIENIRQLLNSGNLDDNALQRLTTALAKLSTVLVGEQVSRTAIITALSEATSAIAGTDGTSKTQTMEQKTEQLWQKIEVANKNIDDDFEKMREAGISFNDKLWNRHKELMEYLKAHPHDIQKQKELDAVDDALLLQAESQLKDHPAAEQPFKDASDKSKERHEIVDKYSAAIKNNEATNYEVTLSDIDTVSLPPARNSDNLTMNDVTVPSAGQKPKPGGKHYG